MRLGDRSSIACQAVRARWKIPAAMRSAAATAAATAKAAPRSLLYAKHQAARHTAPTAFRTEVNELMFSL